MNWRWVVVDHVDHVLTTRAISSKLQLIGWETSLPTNSQFMPASDYAIGQAVFIRTDTPDYKEEVLPFRSLEEMVKICSQMHENLVLEKLVVYAMPEGEPCALTLGFIAATKGQRPEHLPSFDQ